jgi:Fe-S cluster assembly protein SufD
MDVLEEKRKTARGLMDALPWPAFRRGLTMTLTARKPDIDALSKGRGDDVPLFALPYLFTLVTPHDKVSAAHVAHASIRVIHIETDMKEDIIIERKGLDSSADHVLIIMGQGARAKIVEYNECAGDVHFRSEGTEIFLAKGASLEYVSVQNHGEETHAFSFKKARLEEDASLSFVSCILGGKLSKEEIGCDLRGARAQLRQGVLFYGKGDQEIDVQADIHHMARETESILSMQGCVAGNAKSIMQGRIHIGKDAHDAKGYESSDILVLDETANGNAIPLLEIDNQDVSCGHAAKIGHIDAGKLFYLQSRGLSEQEAKRLIIEGFFMPFAERLKDQALQERIMRLIEKKLL